METNNADCDCWCSFSNRCIVHFTVNSVYLLLSLFIFLHRVSLYITVASWILLLHSGSLRQIQKMFSRHNTWSDGCFLTSPDGSFYFMAIVWLESLMLPRQQSNPLHIFGSFFSPSLWLQFADLPAVELIISFLIFVLISTGFFLVTHETWAFVSLGKHKKTEWFLFSVRVSKWDTAETLDEI